MLMTPPPTLKNILIIIYGAIMEWAQKLALFGPK